MNNQYTISFGLEDFHRLYHSSTRSFLSEQLERFEVVTEYQGRCLTPAGDDDGRYMYWLETQSDTLLARKILEAAGHKVSELWDLAAAERNVDDGYSEPAHVLVTDYAGSWCDVEPAR